MLVKRSLSVLLLIFIHAYTFHIRQPSSWRCRSRYHETISFQTRHKFIGLEPNSILPNFLKPNSRFKLEPYLSPTSSNPTCRELWIKPIQIFEFIGIDLASMPRRESSSSLVFDFVFITFVSQFNPLWFRSESNQFDLASHATSNWIVFDSIRLFFNLIAIPTWILHETDSSSLVFD